MALFQGKHVRTARLDDGVAGLVLDHPGSADNALDLAMLDDIDRALDALASDGFRLLILQSAKPGVFCTGTTYARCKDWTPEQFRHWCERGQQVCRKLAESPIVSVAVIGGTCHDEGLELALACDYRVALARGEVDFIFTAQNWGKVPCWGATFRLPRRVGLANSMALWLFGDHYTARRAWLEGLVDEVVEDFDSDPPSFLESPQKRDPSSFPSRTWRQRWLENTRLGRGFMMRGYERMLRTRIPSGMMSFAILLQRLRDTYANKPIDVCEAGERDAIAQIAASPMMHHFLRLLNRRDRWRERAPQKSGKQKKQTVGIIGADDAALTLLLQCVSANYHVVMQAPDEAALGTAMTGIAQFLAKNVEVGLMTSDAARAFTSKLKGTTNWGHFQDVEFVLDPSTGEVLHTTELYQRAEKEIPAKAVIVSLHATHEMATLAKKLREPTRLLGLRTFKSWEPSTLAEIVPFAKTPAENVNRVRNLASDLGYSCLNVADRAGGLALRVWLPMFNEVGVLIREGVRIADIDAAMIRFGMKEGPCEIMDPYGLDRIADAIKQMQPIFGERIRFETGFVLMTKKGWTGANGDQGFYRSQARFPRPSLESQELWQAQSQGEPTTPMPVLSRDELFTWIQNRLVTLTVLEAHRCLAERIVDDADDLDCAISLTGWATHRGGPLGYAADVGAEAFAQRCRELAAKHGARYLQIGPPNV